MNTVQTIYDFLEGFAPTDLAEDWDNVGLLVGDRSRPVSRVMTCLTVTPTSSSEAIKRKADLVVTHHPVLFRPISRLTSDDTAGRLLLDLIAAGVAVYSPHTALDSAPDGINQQLARHLSLENIAPLIPIQEGSKGLGSGRFGTLSKPTTVSEIAKHLKGLLGAESLGLVGDRERKVQSIAVACGSAGEMLAPAHQQGCDLFVTGEANFHTCLEAEATGMALLLLGHFHSERFALEQLAQVLAEKFSDLEIWASQQEANPIDRI